MKLRQSAEAVQFLHTVRDRNNFCVKAEFSTDQNLYKLLIINKLYES
jgi:hypothetical protein